MELLTKIGKTLAGLFGEGSQTQIGAGNNAVSVKADNNSSTIVANRDVNINSAAAEQKVLRTEPGGDADTVNGPAIGGPGGGVDICAANLDGLPSIETARGGNASSVSGPAIGGPGGSIRITTPNGRDAIG